MYRPINICQSLESKERSYFLTSPYPHIFSIMAGFSSFHFFLFSFFHLSFLAFLWSVKIQQQNHKVSRERQETIRHSTCVVYDDVDVVYNIPGIICFFEILKNKATGQALFQLEGAVRGAFLFTRRRRTQYASTILLSKNHHNEN